jgi:hypothetical protein
MFSESPVVRKLYERLSQRIKVVSQDIENKVQNTLSDRSHPSQIETNQPTYLDEMLILQTLKTIENKAKERIERSDSSWQ